MHFVCNGVDIRKNVHRGAKSTSLKGRKTLPLLNKKVIGAWKTYGFLIRCAYFPQSYEYEFQSGIFPFYLRLFLRLFLTRNGLLRPFRVIFIAVFGRRNPEF